MTFIMFSDTFCECLIRKKQISGDFVYLTLIINISYREPA